MKSLHVFEMDMSIMRAEKDVLFNAFQIWYEEANDALMNASVHFVEMILSKMAHRGASDDMSERNIEELTRYPASLNA